MFKTVLIIVNIILLTACSSASSKLSTFTQQNNFTRTDVQGSIFNHRIYLNSVKPLLHNRWHVYIEGDGKPWNEHRYVNFDPTPTNPIMLHLMALDQKPSIYLGRPCYFGLSTEDACQPLIWTHERYSAAVVESMVGALKRLIHQYQIAHIALIGHSGGATLAMLIAPKLKNVDTVVTLAGNLDIDAWTQMHGYSRLVGSLNPRDQAPLPASIHQYHYASVDDENIPPEMIEEALDNQPDANITLLAGLTHDCCWQDVWPEIIRKVKYLQ